MKKYKIYIITLLIIIATLITICFIPIGVSRLIPVVEEQVSKELGVNIHVEKLILRVGPLLKVKAPIMHVMYEDGQKFAQFDNVKFYIPWNALLKSNPFITMVDAKKLTVRVNSNDKYLPILIDTLQKKEFNEIPNFRLKEYNFTYYNKENKDKYVLEGQNFDLEKISTYHNLKIKSTGNLSINNQKYITYDFVITPNLEIGDIQANYNLSNLIEQIKELDFHSDIIADVKLYKNTDSNIQASGFINIDNISVLDKTKKNPKSFVYLTLWGDKASILSNIYTSVNKKVYIEGMVNNSKKPVIDLKVKTDEIDIADLYQKLKIFTDLSDIKNIKSIGGTLNANFSLKGDLNKIKSTGFLKINDAYVNADGLQINKINSDIDFSNNIINIVKAVGYVKNAPIIAKGTIDKNINIELLMNKVELQYLCPSSYGVKGGIASLIANITGTLDNITHKENLLVENLKITNDYYDLAVETFKIDTNKNNTAYVNNIVCKTPKTAQIKIPSFKMIVNEDVIQIPDSNIFMPNSKITAKADILHYNNNDISFVLNLSGFINSKDISDFSHISTVFPVKVFANGNKTTQNVNAQVLCEKTDILDEPVVINLISKFDKNTLKVEDLSIVSFSGKFSDDFKLNIKGQKRLTINGNVENLKTPLLKNIRIFIPQQININLFDTIAQIKGDLFLNGDIKKPDIIGQLYIQNLFNKTLQLSLTNCVTDFNKTTAVVNAPQVKIGDSSLGLNALLSTDLSEALSVKNVNIKSKYMNTDTLLMYKDSPILKMYPIHISEGKFYAERLSANVYGSSLYLSAFTADFKLYNNILTVKNITSELFNGKITGSLDYDLKDEHFNSKFMARGVSAAPIFNIVSSRRDSISGVMDFDTDIRGELTSKQSLNGDIKFIVNNGRMSTLGKLEHLLYAQNVIADNMLRTSLSVVTKAITLKDTGLFKYLRGDVYLKNGIAEIKMLQSQGPLMALFIKGQYNTLNDTAKLVVLGRLSDEIISGLGAFGDFSFNKLMIMLTGEDSKQNTYIEDFEKIPQLASKNTKEFRSIINGVIDKPASVISFNWISYSQKSLKQKDIPMTDVKVPSFVDELPY